jgi:hypothetical protein
MSTTAHRILRIPRISFILFSLRASCCRSNTQHAAAHQSQAQAGDTGDNESNNNQKSHFAALAGRMDFQELQRGSSDAPSNSTTVLFTTFPGVSVPLFEALSNLSSIRRAEKQLFSGILWSNHVF